MANQFKGFSKEQMERIASKLGYNGPMSKFGEFLSSNPGAGSKFSGLNKKIALNMSRGGAVKRYEEGGAVPESGASAPLPAAYTPTYQYADQTTPGGDDTIGDVANARMSTPGLPVGGTVIAQSTETEPGQTIDAGTGQVTTGDTGVDVTTAVTTDANATEQGATNTVDTSLATDAITNVANQTEGVDGTVSDAAQMEAAQKDPTTTEVGTVNAAQIEEATTVQAPKSRTLASAELVGAEANAEKGAAFAEQIQAASADPSAAATVAGQLDNLMGDFEGGATPSWAAGAMRNATAMMAARGLTSSSMAGQALVQAAMESALPIAQADAQTTSTFELTNLSNKQARSMLAAEQRATFMGQEFDQKFQARVANASKVSEIANMNFNAEQQIALENAKMAQTVDLANLSNKQAVVMAEAAQIANLETTNLNNRQAASSQNAQAFLAMDMENLSNDQQAEMFKQGARVQALLSDQAAENATKQFNATSENQADQFFANLTTQISQFNAGQANAQSQFNAEQTNVVGKFNEELANSRDQFNATNQLVISQSNATWRRAIATADTAAVNAANETNAQSILNVSNLAYSNLWQEYRDSMEWAWTSAENERERSAGLAIAKIGADAEQYAADAKEDAESSAAWGSFVFEMVKGW